MNIKNIAGLLFAGVVVSSCSVDTHNAQNELALQQAGVIEQDFPGFKQAFVDATILGQGTVISNMRGTENPLRETSTFEVSLGIYNSLTTTVIGENGKSCVYTTHNGRLLSFDSKWGPARTCTPG